MGYLPIEELPHSYKGCVLAAKSLLNRQLSCTIGLRRGLSNSTFSMFKLAKTEREKDISINERVEMFLLAYPPIGIYSIVVFIPL